jgi:hypothetical protein
VLSLSNALTSAFKELDPIPQLRAMAKLKSLLEAVSPARNCSLTLSLD